MERVRTRRSVATALGVAAVVLVVSGASAQSPTARSDVVLRVSRVNVSTGGTQANGTTFGAVLSASGGQVAFVSGATKLVRSDLNGVSDVFVRDLKLRRTWRASVSSAGTESNGASTKPSISADGGGVAFPSLASNLVRGDRNAVQDIFFHEHVSGRTERVSMGSAGEPNGASLAALVSADGKVVVFSSDASNLVPGDRNRALDVFATALETGRTSRVSIGMYGESADRSEAASVDGRGLVIAFRSYAANLVGGDENGKADVFVHDRRTGTTERVNVSSGGVEADGVTFRGMVSADGRVVGFRSRADNLVPGDTNDALDVFVHDRSTGETERISVASDGSQADPSGFDRPTRWNLFMSRPFLSASGRYVAFTSRARNLVPLDRNDVADVFVHDLVTGITTRVSVSGSGEEADAASFVSGISADGRVVAFTSFADNLVPGDTNGRRDVFVAQLRVKRDHTRALASRGPQSQEMLDRKAVR